MLHLKILSGGRAGETVEVQQDVLVIGSAAGSELCLSDEGISSEHCRIVISPDRIRVDDLESDTVDFIDNYDGKYREPLVLPSRLPNLLVNGSDGIAVGMATDIPPHNLKEVCDGLIRMIDEPDVSLQDLLEIIPDTPRNRELKARIGAAVRKYGGIGVRIEDDYVISARGVEWLSRAPREIEEIEALMAERFAGPAARDAAKVEWYRSQPR